METIIDYLHIGARYYRTNQKPLAAADPMVMLFTRWQNPMWQNIKPKRHNKHDKDYCTNAPEITYMYNRMSLLFCGASYVSALPKRWPPLMLSHSGGLKINEDYGR
ncbi:hypothetical protein [Mucilaginibacter sp.]|uniref:hypothetical protein n=1 Tax=Mucilaginibacter sp. TaxID=1882438 RepID=UPI0025D4F234|nr:hypothetical protein [Mucilaginibacter sp.]